MNKFIHLPHTKRCTVIAFIMYVHPTGRFKWITMQLHAASTYGNPQIYFLHCAQKCLKQALIIFTLIIFFGHKIMWDICPDSYIQRVLVYRWPCMPLSLLSRSRQNTPLKGKLNTHLSTRQHYYLLRGRNRQCCAFKFNQCKNIYYSHFTWGTPSYYMNDYVSFINPLAPNDVYIRRYRTANLQTLHFKYLLNKYT